MSAKIHKAIVAVMREVGAIGKDVKNTDQKYSYRSVEQVYNRVQPLFAIHGIYSYPKVTEQSHETGKTKAGGTMNRAILTVEYTFAADDGSSIAVTVVGEGMDMSDKASNKAMSAAHKYAICQVLNIPYQVIDPDKSTPEWATKLADRVTLVQTRNLYTEWASRHAGDLEHCDKEGKKKAFAEWVKKVLGGAGPDDVGEFADWTVEDLEKCQEVLK